MKEYLVTLKITGTAVASVKANSIEEAKVLANKYEFEDDSDDLVEWNFDEVESVKELED